MRRVARAALSTTLAAVVAVALSACGGTQTVHRTVDAVKVEGGAGFAPVTLTVDKRNRVKMTVGNATATTHGFSIEGYGIHREVKAGEAIKVDFTATHAGTYRVYCQLHPAHKTATLVVR